MPALSNIVADRFTQLCDDANYVWQVWRAVAAAEPDRHQPAGLPKKAALAFREMFSAIRDKAILQVVRLHDEATISGKVTLTIDYVVKYGGWPTEDGAKLAALQTKLNGFVGSAKDGKLRAIRNRALAHNDMAAILSSDSVGVFEHGESESYFKALEEFASLVSQGVKGASFTFRSGGSEAGEALARTINELKDSSE